MVVGIFVVLAFCGLGTIGGITWAVMSTNSMDGWDTSFGSAVGIVRLEGVISGSGTGDATPERVIRQLRKALDDDSVKAIVIRVESPGGTVAASEEIALAVKDARADKPIVISIGDQGASGAYMVSSQASKIFALPGSSVGSIGVIAEVPNLEGLLKKLGVEFAVITAGKYKGAGNPFEPLTDEERDLIQKDVDEVYNQFIDIVADGRKMPRSEVESLATGWAWNGSTAKELGLVDEIGGFSDAIDAAAKLGGISGSPRLVEFDEYNPAELFGSLVGQQGVGGLLPSKEKLPASLPR